MIVMGDLNAKLDSGSTLLEYVMRKHVLDDRNDNGEKFDSRYSYSGAKSKVT